MKKFFYFLFLFVTLNSAVFLGFPQNWKNFPVSSKIYKAQAINYLTNPSFTENANGWILSNFIYDGEYFQDSGGSVKIETITGRNNGVSGDATQIISTNINSSDTVDFNFFWSKQCVAISCSVNTVGIDIAKPSNPNYWISVWSNNSTPAVGNPTTWTSVFGLDVSSYFDETGEYKIRLSGNLKNGNDKNAKALAWLDNFNLNVVPAIISISISDGNVSYGKMALNSTKDTTLSGLNDSQIITNNGTVVENINIKGKDSDNWGLAGVAGGENYTHKFCISDCNSAPIWTNLTTSYQVLTTGLGISDMQSFDLQLGTPITTSFYNQQNVSVTVQAVAH